MRIERGKIGRANEKEIVGRAIRQQPKRWSVNKEIKNGCGQSCVQNGKLTFWFTLWTRFFGNLEGGEWVFRKMKFQNTFTFVLVNVRQL